jgi:hypothetical protein
MLRFAFDLYGQRISHPLGEPVSEGLDRGWLHKF